MIGVNDIRAAFLAYFQAQDHKIVASAPLVPIEDPSLIFTNAGMVPFKKAFLSPQTAPDPRAASSQKCLRAGGKHNDLDNVGYTSRHHTFFEMLGNFSFGDYFKEQAIILAWNFLTKDLALPTEKLSITVYAEDEEAKHLWQTVSGLPEQSIYSITGADNFWSMGETGPCGPCSEIFYDHGSHIAGGPPGSAHSEGDRFVEIWNLVFMQYETMADGKRLSLPRPSIDTGMGLERIAAVLQGVHDNYDIDLFGYLIEVIGQITDQSPAKHKAAMRVIADHLRASSFLIAEGVLPANEGRGYVLRRIMRRAMRHARQLETRDALMYRLVPALIDQMGEAFPELGRAKALITKTLRDEEEKFRETLERGLHLLDEAITHIGKTGILPGKVAFKLYDTYGFPLDLTADILREQGLGIDQAGFDTAMQQQKLTARKSWKGSGDTPKGETPSQSMGSRLGKPIKPTEFCGYEAYQGKATLLAILDKYGHPIKSQGRRLTNPSDTPESLSLIVDKTPFYAESGGQSGDQGRIITDSGTVIDILDTQRHPDGIIEHQGQIQSGSLTVGDKVHLEIDVKRRAALSANHSATHLLHAVLRQELGKHVTQKGSLVAPDHLRFDISHPQPVTTEEMERIQSQVNRLIRQNSPVETESMPLEEAMSKGAMALFGEKYGEKPQVVSMGQQEDQKDDTPFSIELCGGTHVKRTGDIGFFLITGEQAVGSGLRRLEALSGYEAEKYLTFHQNILHQAAFSLQTSPENLVDRLLSLRDDKKQLTKSLARARHKLAALPSENSLREIAGVPFAERFLENVPARDLKPMADAMKQSLGSAIIALAGCHEGKASLVVAVSDDLTPRFNAIDLVKIGAKALGGKGGGGRPDMAQAGGPNGKNAPKALEAIATELRQTQSKDE